MSNQLALFDYAALPPADVTEVRAAAERIRVRMRRTAQDMIDTGIDLLGAKERLPHGQFGHWIESEFGWSHRTANYMMSAARRFGNKFAGNANLGVEVFKQLLAPDMTEDVANPRLSTA